MKAHLVRAYLHSCWANERVLSAAADLPAAQITSGHAAARSSLRETLLHLVSTEALWLDRLQGRSPDSALEVHDFASIAWIAQRWRRVMSDFADHLSGMAEADFEHRVPYRSLSGEIWEYRAGDIVLQVLLQAAYYRGRATTLIRTLGGQALATDFLIFIDDQEG